eukprot:bmy_20168T0
MPGSELEIRMAVTTGCLFPPPDHELALRNALRYFPPDTQELLAPEFAQELRLYGHIYMYRFCPDIEMKAYPVEQYPCRTRVAAAIMHMIMNNLDPAVAQFPQELVTYGGNGQVFSNWAQMTEEQTLVMYSGHPLGLFPSSPGAPRLVITNGMVIPNYSSRMEYEKLFAMGVTIRASWSQVDGAALMKRHKQGWLMEVTDSLDRCIERLREARKRKEALSLGYHGNVVDLWERLVRELDTTGELLVDLGSDQTSCHNPFNGGYYPVQLGFAEAQSLMASDPAAFKALLKRHLQSHDKLRPFGCPVGGCGKKFTTVYNLRAHMKGHEQESLFKCEVCAERFPTHAKLSSHQRSHFEPERPYKCDFPGCEKTFITVSALFSHNRAHFREQELFSCSFPGCSKQYDKACRLKIHLRSHTGERPFICDSDSCGWTFTSMSKLLRHKRKHDEDRRFPCPVEGCGKSFTRAEHLKGHSVTHLGTKPFACPVEERVKKARFVSRTQ